MHDDETAQHEGHNKNLSSNRRERIHNLKRDVRQVAYFLLSVTEPGDNDNSI